MRKKSTPRKTPWGKPKTTQIRLQKFPAHLFEDPSPSESEKVLQQCFDAIDRLQSKSSKIAAQFPPAPNLFIQFTKEVWTEPDLKLLAQLSKRCAESKWLPRERKEALEGPYVRLLVDKIPPQLERLLRNSHNVWEWDREPFYTVCRDHGNNFCKPIKDERDAFAICLDPRCKDFATLVY